MHINISLVLVVVACLIGNSNQITKYDFNVCRIKFCAEKQAACVSDESSCMDAFARTRTCFLTCTSGDQLETYNKCWSNCKQAGAYSSNSLYYDLGQCYENVCYLSSPILSLLGLSLILIIFMLA